MTNKDCKTYDAPVSFGINIIVHVSFLLFVLTSVFLLYTSNLMSDSLNNNITTAATSNFDKILNYISKKDLLKLNVIGKNLPYDKLREKLKENEMRNVNNSYVKDILINRCIYLFALVVIIILIVKLLCTNVHIFNILGENFIIFAFIGMIEILFFKLIILKYIPAYPSDQINIFLEKLKKY